MHTIYKYPLQLRDFQRIQMPARAKILHADLQNQTLCIWALVDPDLELESRDFLVAGTGNPLPLLGSLSHIGTVQTGGFVWHVFEIHQTP